MEAVAKLINEFGRLPKENMCVQEVGLSDAQSVTFLQNCVMFFEIFIDVSIYRNQNCLRFDSAANYLNDLCFSRKYSKLEILV